MLIKQELLRFKTPNMVCVSMCSLLNSQTIAAADSQDDLQLNTLKGTATSQRFKLKN